MLLNRHRPRGPFGPAPGVAWASRGGLASATSAEVTAPPFTGQGATLRAEGWASYAGRDGLWVSRTRRPDGPSTVYIAQPAGPPQTLHVLGRGSGRYATGQASVARAADRGGPMRSATPSRGFEADLVIDDAEDWQDVYE